IRDFHVTGVQTCALPICLKAGYLLAGILIFSVVPGRTPVRDLRWRTSNVPKPVSWTFDPESRDLLIWSSMASMMSLTSFFLRPLDSATLLTRSAFETVLAFAIGILLVFEDQLRAL